MLVSEDESIVWDFWAERYRITVEELQSWKDDPAKPMHCASCGWHGTLQDIPNKLCPNCNAHGNFEPCINGRCMFGRR